MLWSEINTLVTDLTNADTTAFPTATRLIYANAAQAEVSGDIIGCDGRWQWDDTNYTNRPIGKANLVSGQQDYGFDDTFLYVERVEIFNSSGDKFKLSPIDSHDIDVALSEYQSTNGTPLEYDKVGASVLLYPAPDYNYTNGLFVHFKRKTKDITTFGSDSPGFIATEHMILPYKIAIPYCIKFHPERVALYEQKVREHQERIKAHYSRRSKDERPIMTMKKINHL